MNRLKLVMALVGLVVAVVLLWWVFTHYGILGPARVLGAVLGGVGAAVGVAKVTRDEGRATRGDLGARGVERVKVKSADGKETTVTRRRRPRRGGSNRF